MNKKNKIILVGSIIIGTLLSLFASASPDGLERVAVDRGFINSGKNYISGLFSDYLIPGITNEIIAAVLAGLVGTVLTFCLIYFIGQIYLKLKIRNES
jgi:cobalt/nickel transport protein